MKWLCSVAALGALFLTACDKPQAAAPSPTAAPMSIDDFLPKQAQPKLQTMKLYLGTAELDAELCLDDTTRMTGMMYRTNFPPTAGMLFVFPQASQLSFWMKNTSLHLSAAYINTEGVIEDIVPLKPFDTNSVYSSGNRVQYVLEVTNGWFKANGVSTGAVVRTERGTLRELLPLVR
jgi:uncharacterized membrane protein (UPF0127 family)